MKLLKSKTANGVNLKSAFLELFGITIHIGYCYNKGFPLSAWGDATFFAFQSAIVAYLILLYGFGQNKANKFLAFYAIMATVILLGVIPMRILGILQALKISDGRKPIQSS